MHDARVLVDRVDDLLKFVQIVWNVVWRFPGAGALEAAAESRERTDTNGSDTGLAMRDERRRAKLLFC